jgi:hypothetical protein
MDERKEAASGPPAQHGSAANPSIDIARLAEKVYQLMRAEARLSRARGNTRGARR